MPENGMRVFGTTACGLRRKSVRFCLFQTMPLRFIGPEKRKPSTLPAVLPSNPCRLGPTPFSPAASEWQAMQASNAFLPASSARAAPPANNAAATAMENIGLRMDQSPRMFDVFALDDVFCFICDRDHRPGRIV